MPQLSFSVLILSIALLFYLYPPATFVSNLLSDSNPLTRRQAANPCTDTITGIVILTNQIVPRDSTTRACSTIGLSPLTITVENFSTFKAMIPLCLANAAQDTLWIGSYYGSTLLSPIAVDVQTRKIVKASPAKLAPVACGPFYDTMNKAHLRQPFQNAPAATTLGYGGNADMPLTITSTVTQTTTVTNTVTSGPTPTVCPTVV